MCGHCPGCMSLDCGICQHCLDMPKHGGAGNMQKQCCTKRQCLNLTLSPRLSKFDYGSGIIACNTHLSNSHEISCMHKMISFFPQEIVELLHELFCAETSVQLNRKTTDMVSFRAAHAWMTIMSSSIPDGNCLF